jgi:DnaJ-class molecular chaperone
LEILVVEEDQEVTKLNNRGSDLRYDLSITLEEAYSGKKQDIQFSTSEKCNTVKEMVQNLVILLTDVHIVVEMEK